MTARHAPQAARPHRTSLAPGRGNPIKKANHCAKPGNNISTHFPKPPLSPNRTSHLPPSIAPKPTTHFLHRQFGLTSTKLSADPTFGAEERSRQTATTSPRPRCTRTNTKRSSFDHQARSPPVADLQDPSIKWLGEEEVAISETGPTEQAQSPQALQKPHCSQRQTGLNRGRDIHPRNDRYPARDPRKGRIRHTELGWGPLPVPHGRSWHSTLRQPARTPPAIARRGLAHSRNQQHNVDTPRPGRRELDRRRERSPHRTSQGRGQRGRHRTDARSERRSNPQSLEKLNLVTHDSEIVHLFDGGWTIDELAGTFGVESNELYERFIRSGINPERSAPTGVRRSDSDEASRPVINEMQSKPASKQPKKKPRQRTRRSRADKPMENTDPYLSASGSGMVRNWATERHGLR